MVFGNERLEKVGNMVGHYQVNIWTNCGWKQAINGPHVSQMFFILMNVLDFEKIENRK
jgi:hypothetical protein